MGVIETIKRINQKTFWTKLVLMFFVVNFFFTSTVLATDPAPTISGISPNNGLPAGGNSVTITGTGFLGGGVVATGGTITTSGAYTIHTFTSSDTFSVTNGGEVEYLVVAGGGGGGTSSGTATGGGGGGAGDMHLGNMNV
ncbi:MAG: IPT/TIG domain-containing protein, partial [Candidatus Moranbacteria bacterium]|nr:IPT/TIG domain-containing protein [Candidatus Moranbacteria bacterium]